MNKNFATLFAFFFIIGTYNTFSQETLISTKFLEDGTLYESPNDFYNPLIQFKENEKCEVISFVGNYTYKVKFKDFEGFVKDDFLSINEAMMDLYFDHEEKQRKKAIAEKEQRQKRIKEITKSTLEKENEKKRQDSMAKAKEIEHQKLLLAIKKEKREKALLEQTRIQDSIAKIEEIKKQNNLAAIEYQNRKQAELKEILRQDSITKAKEAENKKLLIAIENENKKLQQIKEAKRLDSIAKTKEIEHQKLLLDIQKEKRQKVQLEQSRIRDSINKVKEIERLNNLAAIQYQNRKQAELKEILIQDSIAKAKNIEHQKRLAAIENQKKKQVLLKQAKKQDSINKAKEEVLNTKLIEENKLRHSCHYFINEYDNFLGKQVIITEKYNINQSLNIELLREGFTSKININLAEDLGCVSYVPNTRSSVRINLKNNQTVTLYHSGNLDCLDFSLKAILSQTKISQLQISPIKSITLRGTKRSVTISDIDYPEFFIDKLECIE